MKNPQVFQRFQSLVESTNDPQKFLNQLTNNYTDAQKEQFIKFANGYGVSVEQLKNYGIK